MSSVETWRARRWSFWPRSWWWMEYFQPIGCHGWYARGGTRAWFDQQPVDVIGMVLLYLTAARIFQDERYQELATLSLDWFFGRNALGGGDGQSRDRSVLRRV